MQTSYAGGLTVLGDCVADNLGAEFVEYLALAPCAIIRYLT